MNLFSADEIKNDRISAFLTDIILIWPLSNWLISWVFSFLLNFSFGGYIYAPLLLTWFLCYFFVIPRKFGCTIGQYVSDLKIIDVETGNTPSLIKLFRRGFLFATVATGIGYLYFLSKGYYWDKITKTDVVRGKEKEINFGKIIKIITSHIKYLIITFLIIVILTSLFYWFEWRPSKIRENCAKRWSGEAYNKCIHKQGLER